MPGGFPLGLELCNGVDIGSNLTTGGVAVTCGNAAKGSWTQLIASTANDICALQMSVKGNNNTKQLSSVDLGIGAGGSEVIILSDFMVCSNTGDLCVNTTPVLPICIPAGSRIAARGQTATGAPTETNWVNLRTFDGAFTQIEGYAGVDGIGFDSVNTKGVQITSGVANTKGSYVQMIASTARDYAGFFLEMGEKDDATTTATSVVFIDVAIGAGGSEVIILPNQMAQGFEPFGGAWGLSNNFFPIPIPAGTRIAIRFSCAAVSLTAGFMIYGVYQ